MSGVMSDSNTVKLTFKHANLEVSYEGSEEFLKQELFSLAEQFSNFTSGKDAVFSASSTQIPQQQTNKEPPSLTTLTIANDLDAESGVDMIIAAMAKLKFTDQKDTVRREEIKQEMESAPSKYNTNMGKNFKQNINSLVKQKKVREVGSDTYSLSQAQINELQNQIDFTA